MDKDSKDDRLPRAFVTTQWTIVLAAGDSKSPGACDALERLCTTYWYPLYAYSRRKGISSQLSEDLVQGFFAQLFRLKSLSRVDRQHGRFRSFLLASFNHFISDEYARENAKKRGGDVSVVSVDAISAEERFALEPVDSLTPEDLFERRWALTLLERALIELEDYYKAAGNHAFFLACKESLYGNRMSSSYAEISVMLKITESALKMAIMRMRRRYRSILLQKVADTVEASQDVEDELNHLMSVVSK